ncbi:MAG: potassium transporter Kup [Proteobacteria bacterium]|nr:potassium transporter Kup [Pseudomonadota bacterium]
MNPSPTAPIPDSRLTLAALGVVFGDIGTSPLYAFRTCFDELHGTLPTEENVLGLLSLIVWALTAVITVKYVMIILRADNRGEGGALALMALVLSGRSRVPRRWMLLLGILGTTLFFSDGAITPAISVLSAVEGLEVINDEMEGVVIPLVIAILVGLFAVQRHGTGAIGQLFGPLMMIWFVVLALLGLRWIAVNPVVLHAVDPTHAVRFLLTHRSESLIVMAAVFLAVTGGEALYADMGHFGRRPIRLAWFCVVLPALVLNYFGQGARVLADPYAVVSPFFLLAPKWGQIPLVLLSTAATVIASQAVISGVFSIAHQALRLGLLPRFLVVHSSGESAGQVFVPGANRILLVATIGLVLAFGSSEALASAYGIAIALAMLIDSILVVAWLSDGADRRTRALLAVMAVAVLLDLAFLAANSLKIPHGGWLPLFAGTCFMGLMLTWQAGRLTVLDRATRRRMPMRELMARANDVSRLRVPGTAVYLSGSTETVPGALHRMLEIQGFLHERVVLLTIETGDEPRTVRGARVRVQELAPGLFRVVARCGFMETPNAPALLREAEAAGLPYRPAETQYFLGLDHVVVARTHGMPRWQKRLYAYMSRNEHSATEHFRLPPARVTEIGEQIDI